MTQRIAIYARYSSDLQSASSIEDQIRLCNEKAAAQGWEIQQCYTDAGISGATLLRPGIQALMQAAMNGEFDILLAEAMDRLSRDQEDIAGLFKRMEFAGIKIFTLSEGELSSLHIGLKGTMNALFLKDLADKTRRGLRGRVEKGKSGGGLAYAYQVVKQFNANGEAIRGDRSIDEVQAEIVRRIFHEYAHENKSPKAIASDLNKEGIPCPSGKAWGQSTINGNRKRGTGILNNHLYIGELIWNRQRMLKDPQTGRRISRINAESEWIRQSVPDLRIVSEELWDAAKARQKQLDKRTGNMAACKRPQYLLSGLLVCGQCGSGYSMVNAERYGCSGARNKGESVCSNKKTVKRNDLENKVLDALKNYLMQDELVQVFCVEYARHMNSMRSTQNAELARNKAEAATLVKDKESIIQAIKDGVPASMIKDELVRISTRQDALTELMEAQSDEPQPLIHPTMSRRYRKAIVGLHKALNDQQGGEAKEHVRALIEKITLTPKENRKDLAVDLYGDLAGILKIATEDKSMKNKADIIKKLEAMTVNDNHNFERSIQLVAGAGFEPTTFGL
jgi:site-specific DNA recombinase